MMQYSLRSLFLALVMASVIFAVWTRLPTLVPSLLLLAPLPVLLGLICAVPPTRRRVIAIPFVFSCLGFYVGITGPAIAAAIHPAIDDRPAISRTIRNILPVTHGWLLALPKDTVAGRAILDYQLGWCEWADPSHERFGEI